ncbi:leucine-rich repeat protein kinase family protein [Wolffia australiana]
MQIAFILVLLLSASSGQAISDYEALLEFKNGIKQDPPGGPVESWSAQSLPNSNDCPTDWQAVQCSSGRIVSISLNFMNLTGVVDLSALTGMEMLSNLSLSHNRLSGLVLPQLGTFPSLAFLDLSDNFFSGEIPAGLTMIETLVSLNLSSNNFSGLLPASLGNLKNLAFLDLTGNAISGEIERCLLLLKAPVRVDFSRNAFTGSLRSLPDDSSLLGSIKYLNISHNQISGELFPDQMPLFDILEVFDASHNQLQGQIPSFNFLVSLRVLLLHHNRFFGPLRDFLLKEGSLTLGHLDLSSNSLEGPIGSITSTTLRILNLSSNKLTGSLPLRVGSCASVDLSGNRISGNFSRVGGWGNFVEAIDLSSNALQGTLPKNTSLFLRLVSLKASNNSLQGELPAVLGTYRELQVLDLSLNKLFGPLPQTLFESFRLSEVNLSGNSLTGSIPLPSSQTGTPQNYSLQSLDLSDNSLGGFIPLEMGDLAGLRLLDLGRNNFSGPIPVTISNLKALQSLDLHDNRLEGEIPGGISSRLTSLDLSSNNLSGRVPSNLLGFPDSAFFPGNSLLILPRRAAGGGDEASRRHRWKRSIRIVAIVGLAAAAMAALLFFLLVFYWATVPRRRPEKAQKEVAAAHKEEAQQEGELVGRDEAAQQSPLSSLFTTSPEVRSPDKLMGELHLLDSALSFSVEELSRAPAEIIGRSFHGTTYRATLPAAAPATAEHVMAVKWLREGISKGKKDFSREARKLGHVKHPNIVLLRAFYWGPRDHERLLISDYFPALSLTTHLSEWETRKLQPLTAERRLGIAVDAAKGLTYLHGERGVPHGNLKSSNVLVGEAAAMLSDFSLHRILTAAGTADQVLNAGALGYRPPEFAATSKPCPSLKSDVYAFGVVLLELITGRSAAEIVSGDPSLVDLTDWVRLLASQNRAAECFDRSLLLLPPPAPPSFPPVLDGILQVALRCIGPASDRPEMATVLRDLRALE